MRRLHVVLACPGTTGEVEPQVSGNKRSTTTKLGTTQENEETAAPCESTENATPYSSCCCGKVKIQMGCHIVGISSLLATISNATLYFFGVPRLGLSGTFEVILLAADFFTVLSLFLGLLKHRAGLMKPYILFNSVWILSLCLLLTVCLWKLAKGSDLPNNILSNLRSLRSHTADDEHDHTQQMHHSIAVPSEDSSLVTAAVMVGLVIVIIVDGFFLHVVYRTFCFFAYLESKRKEETFGQLTTTTL
ncbi:hypothetical protein OSTOST_07491 [Ostertagia ostertagi]